ncbi:GpE family phage tail protein [Deltaproteobacteria bacterium OttesenSCG-928-M10]|nr:GpE family phage tail protein [Deltaproteobacteria bacterium OttesenSCG-928-M10]
MAWVFKWPPSELNRLSAADLLFWVRQLELLQKERPRHE